MGSETVIGKRQLTHDISRSIPNIDRNEWDGLITDDNFFNSYEWLESLDHAQGACEILTLHGPAGLFAGCALWPGESDEGMFSARSLFPNLPHLWGQRFLWGGARRSTHNELACTPGAKRTEALRCMMTSAKNYAEQKGLAGFIVPYMPLRRALEIVDCTPGTHALLHAAEATMQVPSGGLVEMLDSWSSHDRIRSKAELAAFEKYENTVRWLPLTSDLDEDIAKLISNNRNKYGASQDEKWLVNILRGQRKSGVINRAIAVLSSKKNKINAVTVFYQFGECLHARYFGSDYTITDNDFRYFVLTYYLSAEYAATNGLKKCCLSISALEAKAKRGSLIEPLAAVMMSCDDTLSVSDVRDHNNLFALDYEHRFKSKLTTDWKLLSA